MYMSAQHTLQLLLALPLAAAALNPGCAPGGNFDLSKWELQLPTGSSGNVDTVPASRLQGCGGYQDPGHQYFFTESGDGALVMKTPGSNTGCARTPGSQHCRTELRETSPSSWDPDGATNRLFVQLAGTSGSSIVIGQVFQANSGYSKPFAELYYNSNSGALQLGVAYAAQGGQGQKLNSVGNIPQGQVFTYELRFEHKKLCISVNGGGCQQVDTYFDTPGAFFKAGDYNQANDQADLHVFQLRTTH